MSVIILMVGSDLWWEQIYGSPGKGGRILLNRARTIAKASDFYCLLDHLS